MTTALVLGAGGAGALVFHAGVLDGLAAVGLDPDVDGPVVGTSAGAVTGAFVRLGRNHDEAVRDWLRPPTDEERRQVVRQMIGALRPWPLDVGVAERLARGVPPLAVLAPLLPAGVYPTAALVPWFGEGEPIPGHLWVPAMHAATARTVVFGRDRHVPLADALVATMAVPGMFQPHAIDGDVYLDGGTLSSTHADLVLGSGVDRAIISAPMARPDHGWVLRHAARRLEAEVGRLRRAGVHAVVLTPDIDHQALFDGFPRRGAERAQAIRDHGFERTVTALG